MSIFKAFLMRLIGMEMSRKEKIEAYLEGFRKEGVRIGCNVNMWGVTIDSLVPFLVEIGDNCTITGGTKILAHDASLDLLAGRYKIGRVNIRENTFIGMDTIIMPGVQIGPNAIIGANSVVTGNIPPNTVAIGIPARVICTTEEYLKKYEADHKDGRVVTLPAPNQPMGFSEINEFRRVVKELMKQ
jgi:acetyltransferase-like isoleucine patch superfamily enzyme